MTREERENVLHCLRTINDEEVCEECNLYETTGTDHCQYDMVKLAIEVLSEPTTITDICGNCVNSKCVFAEKGEVKTVECRDYKPKIEPTRPKAKWIRVENKCGVYKCSNCNKEQDWTRIISAKYCIYCGAEMESE